KFLLSPIVRIGAFATEFRSSAARRDFDGAMYRTWQAWTSSPAETRRMVRRRRSRVLPWINLSRAPAKGSPARQIVNGDSAPENACGGHSTNFAKLKMKAAFTSYSAEEVCAPGAGKGANSNPQHNRMTAASPGFRHFISN